MLVLSRFRDQSIMIGDDVRFTIVAVKGDKVRIGITAPREIAVHRQEVYDAIQEASERHREELARTASGTDASKEASTDRDRPATDGLLANNAIALAKWAIQSSAKESDVHQIATRVLEAV